MNLDVIRDILIPSFFELVLIVGLLIVIRANSKVASKVARTLFMEIITVLLLIVLTDVEMYAASLSEVNFLRLLCSSFIYAYSPVMIVLLILILTDNKKLITGIMLLEILNVLVYIINFFTGCAFWYNEENIFQREALGYTSHIVSIIFLVILLIVVFTRFSFRSGKENLIIIYAVTANNVALAIETIFEVHHILYPTVLTGLLIYYLYLHIQITNDDTREIELQLVNQRSQLMLSQIQPHFLYNTLGTIQVLCKTNPKLAAETVDNFSQYLRGNMNTLSENRPIGFMKEIEHTKVYCKIEMLRFENIRVEYDIKDTAFKLPALSVQPLVENAIRHGVRARDEGIVTIRSYSSEREGKKCHIVEIEDNGIGFDLNGDPKGTGMHMGIMNVRERIDKMMNGTLEITSTLDVGTKVQIVIPE